MQGILITLIINEIFNFKSVMNYIKFYCSSNRILKLLMVKFRFFLCYCLITSFFKNMVYLTSLGFHRSKKECKYFILNLTNIFKKILNKKLNMHTCNYSFVN